MQKNKVRSAIRHDAVRAFDILEGGGIAILPMAFGFGGGEANVPLARAIIGVDDGIALSVPSMMGIILMSGIVVEYSIILVDFAKTL